MPRVFLLAALTLVSVFGHFVGHMSADEIVIGNRPNQRTLADLGLDEKGNHSRSITAGELWQFFHDRGVTSVDQLTLNLDCDGMNQGQSGPIRFQIQDPSNGNILTNLDISSSGSRLEVPLSFDYMQRFSPGSKELIQFDLSELEALATNAKVSVESDSPILGPRSILLITAFFSFWVIVFFVLNRFTKPIQQEDAEDIIVRSSIQTEPVDDPSNSVVAELPINQARVQTSLSMSPPGTRPGQSKMVSAQ